MGEAVRHERGRIEIDCLLAHDECDIAHLGLGQGLVGVDLLALELHVERLGSDEFAAHLGGLVLK